MIKKKIVIMIFFLLNIKASAQFGDRIDCGVVENEDIKEASGVVASRANPGVLWVHNDSGDKNRIFAINEKGKNLGEYYLDNCVARDWEDIAVGPGPVDGRSYIYVADIGDNGAKYEIKYVYRFFEPEVSSDEPPKNHNIQSIDIIKFRYPDGKRDAEALMIDPLTKDCYIISKRELNIRVYQCRYPQPLDRVRTLRCIDTLDLFMIVAADISPSGREIIMKNYHQIHYWKRNSKETIKKTLSRTPQNLPYIKEPQGEAVAWDHKGSGYFTISEEVGGMPCHLYYYPRLDDN